MVEDFSYLVECDERRTDENLIIENLSAAINLFKILSLKLNDNEEHDNFRKASMLKI